MTGCIVAHGALCLMRTRWMNYNGPIFKYESGKHLTNSSYINQVRSLPRSLPFVVFTGLLILAHLVVTPRHVRILRSVQECLTLFRNFPIRWTIHD